MGLTIVMSDEIVRDRNFHFVNRVPEVISIDCGVEETEEARIKFAGLLLSTCPINSFNIGYENRVAKRHFIGDRKIHKYYDVPTAGSSFEQVERLKRWLEAKDYSYSESNN
jgi:hypothetical protein